jgi:SanA protein
VVESPIPEHEANMALFRFIWRRRRIFVVGGLIILILPTLVLATLRVYSAERANGQIYALENVPERPVAIVFGAGIENGGPSPMLADRVTMGAKLYEAGKVKALLLTGDNHITTYNEPEAMRQYALKLGVPDSALVLDYAGFRTYDSCYRAHTIFKVDQAILVTQAFHLDRALLTCNGLGIESVGVSADVVRPEGYEQPGLLDSELREIPSTAFAFVDVISGRKPTFLGEPLPIFTNR